ncbi:hypothetical protein V1477_019232, partial [Vespula maculifrons]
SFSLSRNKIVEGVNAALVERQKKEEDVRGGGGGGKEEEGGGGGGGGGACFFGERQREEGYLELLLEAVTMSPFKWNDCSVLAVGSLNFIKWYSTITRHIYRYHRLELNIIECNKPSRSNGSNRFSYLDNLLNSPPVDGCDRQDCKSWSKACIAYRIDCNIPHSCKISDRICCHRTFNCETRIDYFTLRRKRKFIRANETEVGLLGSRAIGMNDYASVQVARLITQQFKKIRSMDIYMHSSFNLKENKIVLDSFGSRVGVVGSISKGDRLEVIRRR